MEGDTIKKAIANASDELAAIIESYEDLCRSLSAEMAVNAPMSAETLIPVG